MNLLICRILSFFVSSLPLLGQLKLLHVLEQLLKIFFTLTLCFSFVTEFLIFLSLLFIFNFLKKFTFPFQFLRL